MGFNYYVTSERYLDDKIENYPEIMHGGNGRDSYVDTEAVRLIQPDGIRKLLKEAWDRYQLPMAVTESHLHCTREEQLRWFKETWDICCSLKKQGIDIKAVTAWALLGAYDWNSLLTAENFHYEPGSFDISNNKFRRTALGKLVRSLAKE
jgi:dTDP-4-dehydrorhamnose reductase